jgi:hypothetical protein
MRRILKSLLSALVVTVVSIVLISISRRAIPTTEQLISNGIAWFVVAFGVVYVYDRRSEIDKKG